MTTLTLPRTTTIHASADNRSLALSVLEQAREFARASQAENTRRSYESDWQLFESFCAQHGLSALPADPEAIVMFITTLAERQKVASIKRRIAGIANKHRECGFESPARNEVVRRVLQGICRTKGCAPDQKDAITTAELSAMLKVVRGDSLKARRDRALLLIGFAAALRRSEIGDLNVEDVTFTSEGARVLIRRSKGDQQGLGQEIAVPLVRKLDLCAVTALREWIQAAGITTGPLFCSFNTRKQLTTERIRGRGIARLIKGLAEKAGLEGDYSGHSLRAGFCTSAAKIGVPLDRIARVTRHRSLGVLTQYIRRANLFEDSALTAVIQ